MNLQNISIIILTLLPVCGFTENISYTKHIKPIFDKKCIVCHSCYEAPCQLILTHPDGLTRGAIKDPVYDAKRLAPADPSRLFIDAKTTQEWREKDFFTVLKDGDVPSSSTAGLIQELLTMHENNSFKPHSRLPDELGFGLKRENTCPSANELDNYKDKSAYGGMPLGVTGLTDTEHKRIRQWIKQGAVTEPQTIKLSKAERKQISEWEAFLNQKDLRSQLVTRWLYEHLFLAHLHFTDLNQKHFFQIVRSSTPPGKTIQVIATRRPNDHPGKSFYYRLKPVEDTIVFKTHLIFPLAKDTLKKIKDLFLAEKWAIEHLPDYTDTDRSNPFKTFLNIPARARYQFMLDHAEYFVQTFIRGPVCHGQIATDVIRDQFWVFFQAPESDLYITSAEYRDKTSHLMDIAGVEDDLLDGAKTWFTVKEQYDQYSNIRQSAYDKDVNPDFDSIWQGNDNALLTVFRHHDNASVRKGLIGDYPLTVWWMDYPLFERSYYNLVVNFDVFGNIAHQAQTRLYFDLIRNDSERNFLRLLPAKTRQKYLEQWYQGVAKLKLLTSYQEVSTIKQTGIDYKTDQPKREFLQHLLVNFKQINARPDAINRDSRPDSTPKDDINPESKSVTELKRIVSISAEAMPMIKLLPEVSFIRVFNRSGEREIYTLFRNRRHSNVAFMFAEELRYETELDTLSLYPGVLATYPNFIFNIPDNEIDDFVNALIDVKENSELETDIIKKWGVRRTHPNFWELFHDISVYIEEKNPVGAGIMDMGRYENL